MAAKTNTLLDTWESGSIDGARWNDWSGGHASIVSGQLKITSLIASGYFGVDSNTGGNTYDLTGSYVTNQIIDVGDQSLVSLSVFPIYVTKNGDATTQLLWFISGGILTAQKEISGVSTNVFTVTYDPKIHKFVRIRESGGTTYWEYSTDGIAWTTAHSEANPFTLTSVQIGQMIGSYAVEAKATYCIFDNFNISPIVLGAYAAQDPSALFPIQSFEDDGQKKVGMIMWFQGWVGNQPFDPDWANAVRDHEATPVITWEPWDYNDPGGATQPIYKLSNIYNGNFDAYITAFANAAKNWGHPVILRFAHEMNGDWYPWSERVNGNAPGDYILAWRHVYNIFQSVGATNVKFFWCPNNDGAGTTAYSELYPGDAYVDYVGIDSYNWGDLKVWSTWSSFLSLFTASYNILVGITSKPIIIGEFASTESGGDKAAWITDTFTKGIFSLPGIVAVIWFNALKETDWRIESSPAAQAAFVATMTQSIILSTQLISDSPAYKTEILSDDWNSGSIDVKKWNDFSQGNAQIVAKRLKINSTLAGGYFGVDSAANAKAYDFVNTFACCELIDAGNQNIVSFNVIPIYISKIGNPNYQLLWRVTQGTIAAYAVVNGVFQTLLSVPYNPSLHRFVRIRESAGIVYWDYSNNGAVWITIWSMPDPFDLTGVEFGSEIGTFQPEVLTSYAIFDNIDIVPIPSPTVSPPDLRISYTPRNKYAWQIFINNKLFADLTGLCEKRKIVIARDDSDSISCSISVDKLADLAKSLNVNIQDILQSWLSEVRVSRYGNVISSGELQPWQTNVGTDRHINLLAKGWFELLKWRRSSSIYANTSALTILKTEFNNTLARPYGNSGNYNGMVLNLTPAADNSNVYVDMTYDDKTLYDMFQEMTQEHNGFDLEFTWDKKLNVFYPYIGVPRPDIVFTYPHGNVKDIAYSVDPSRSFNSLKARGKGSGTDQLQTLVSDLVSEQKYGLREDVRDYTNITDNGALANAAQADLNIYKTPLVLHSILFDGSGRVAAPSVGSFHVGDLVQVLVTNFQLYQDVNQFFRIDQIEIDIGENDQEDVKLSVSLPSIS